MGHRRREAPDRPHLQPSLPVYCGSTCLTRCSKAPTFSINDVFLNPGQRLHSDLPTGTRQVTDFGHWRGTGPLWGRGIALWFSLLLPPGRCSPQIPSRAGSRGASQISPVFKQRQLIKRNVRFSRSTQNTCTSHAVR
jgi:hypothetical protein